MKDPPLNYHRIVSKVETKIIFSSPYHNFTRSSPFLNKNEQQKKIIKRIYGPTLKDQLIKFNSQNSHHIQNEIIFFHRILIKFRPKEIFYRKIKFQLSHNWSLTFLLNRNLDFWEIKSHQLTNEFQTKMKMWVSLSHLTKQCRTNKTTVWNVFSLVKNDLNLLMTSIF